MKIIQLRRYFRHGMFPQLVAYEACIRHGSVTRAAEELSLAQPTVSCLVKKLSDTLGAPLTVARDRRIEPTPIGIELIALCHELFDAFERFEARRAAIAGGDAAGELAGDDGGEEVKVAALDSPSYDRRAAHLETARCPSPSPPEKPSRSKPRASRSQRAKRKPCATAGES